VELLDLMETPVLAELLDFGELPDLVEILDLKEIPDLMVRRELVVALDRRVLLGREDI
jgi:hypothetical protein